MWQWGGSARSWLAWRWDMYRADRAILRVQRQFYGASPERRDQLAWALSVANRNRRHIEAQHP
jgi:hypothetical protein